MKHHPFFLLASALVLSTALTSAAADKTYIIAPHIDSKVGDVSNVEISGDVVTEFLILQGEKELMRQKMVVTAKADVKMTDKRISDRGDPTELEITVRQLSVVVDGQEKSALPPGSLVTAELDGTQTRFTHDGKPVGFEDSNVLTMAAALEGGEVTSEVMYGLNVPRKIGEEWSGNAELLAKKANDAGQWVVKAEDITSKVKFIGLKKRNGKTYREVQIKDRIENIPAENQLPPGFVAKSFVIERDILVLSPEKYEGDTMEAKVVYTTKLQGAAKDDPENVAKMENVQTYNILRAFGPRER